MVSTRRTRRSSKRKKSKGVISKKKKLSPEAECRICLTRPHSSLSLDAPLMTGEENSKPLLVEALELVMKEKVPRGPKYPDLICEMCAGYLETAYNLITQYQSSKKSILGQLKESEGELINAANDVKKDVPDKTDCKAPVEILIGTEKYSIKDLLIVEEESDDSGNYDGFLQNLGTTVSASFVEKGYQKPKLDLETPSLEIKKVPRENQSNTEPTPVDEGELAPVDEGEVAPVDEDELTPVAEDNEDVLNEPESDSNYDTVWPNGNIKYECPFCSVQLSTTNRFERHITICKKGPSKKVVNPKKKKHKCKICGEVFKMAGSLNYHSKKHVGKKYGCKECDKKFFTSAQATRHNKEVHNKQRTVEMCRICGKGFHYHGGLYYHMKMHENARDLQCSYCPKKFYTTTGHKRHEMTHTGVKPYPCKYCDKKFCTLGERKKHHFKHTGDRPYSCKYCKFTCITLYNLKLHLTTHSGECLCTHCSKSFVDNDILQFHVKSKHKEMCKAEEIQ